MFARKTYKQKLKWLAGASVLALILCYQLSINKTIREYSKYQQSVDGNDHAGLPGISLKQLRSRDEKVDFLYTRFVLDTLQSDKNLLSVTSNYCKANNLRLKEYKPVNLSRTDSSQVLTRLVTVQGSFIICLKFLFMLETEKNAGRVSAAEFKTYTDTQDKKTKLDCTIYIQNIIPH